MICYYNKILNHQIIPRLFEFHSKNELIKNFEMKLNRNKFLKLKIFIIHTKKNKNLNYRQ